VRSIADIASTSQGCRYCPPLSDHTSWQQLVLQHTTRQAGQLTCPKLTCQCVLVLLQCGWQGHFRDPCGGRWQLRQDSQSSKGTRGQGEALPQQQPDWAASCCCPTLFTTHKGRKRTRSPASFGFWMHYPSYGVQVIKAPRGRGPQLNAGWRASKADWVRAGCSWQHLPGQLCTSCSSRQLDTLAWLGKAATE
jgi:hypothetical protein